MREQTNHRAFLGILKNAAIVTLGPIWAGSVVGFIIAVYCHLPTVPSILAGGSTGAICAIYGTPLIKYLLIGVTGAVCGRSVGIGADDTRLIVIVLGVLIAVIASLLSRGVKYVFFSIWLLVAAAVASESVPDLNLGTALSDPGVSFVVLGVSTSIAVILSRFRDQQQVAQGHAGPEDNE
ncbi:MAG: hypothetical protein O3A00_10415 [Planctomycetota bacterium]|nr:hypothetical protein [Planctomycetota bacterium]